MDYSELNTMINHLNDDQLRMLNHLIVDKLRLKQQMKSQEIMKKFDIGDFVSFTSSEGAVICGYIFKFNQKTISIKTEQGIQWNVHPSYLSHVINSHATCTQEQETVSHASLKNTLRDIVTHIRPQTDNNETENFQENISRNAPCPCGSGKKYKRCCATNA